GALLVIESLVMLLVANFVGILGGLTWALALGVSGGSATDRQIAEAAHVMELTIPSPFVVAGVLAVGGVLLLLRRGRPIGVGALAVAIAAQVAFHYVAKEGFHALDLVPCTLHLLAITVALALIPPRAATPATT